jgi:hypothetical protein
VELVRQLPRIKFGVENEKWSLNKLLHVWRHETVVRVVWIRRLARGSEATVGSEGQVLHVVTAYTHRNRKKVRVCEIKRETGCARSLYTLRPNNRDACSKAHTQWMKLCLTCTSSRPCN